MVALGSDTVQAASRGNDLRRRAGLGLAVAWVLVHLWHASPLPYALERATGFVLYGNTTQERGLLVGFALCLAFILFRPRSLKVPGWAEGVFAAIAAVAGSSVFWNYENINANFSDPDGLSLTMAAIGLTMLAWAAIRVFGWFGVALLAFVTTMHLLPLIVGYWRLYHLKNPVNFLHHHWHTSESVFGLFLGQLGLTGFLIVVLGVGLDVLGFGKLVARGALRPLSRVTDIASLASDHRVARNVCALAVLFYADIPRLPYETSGELPYDAIYAWLWNLGGPLSVGAVLYLVFLAVARWPSLPKNEGVKLKRVSVGAGGMLIGVALVLDFLLIVLFFGVAIVFAHFSLGVQRFIAPLMYLALAAAASGVLMAAALHDGGKRQRLLLAIVEVLPIALFFWLTAAERFSPTLSAFYAILLLLLVMTEHCIFVARQQKHPITATFAGCAQRTLLPLCYRTARIMTRVVILVAILNMLMPWGVNFAWYWLSGGG